MYENDWDFSPEPVNEEPGTPPVGEAPELPPDPPAEPPIQIPESARRNENEPIIIYTRPKSEKKRVWPRVLALVLCCALVGGGAGVGAAVLTGQVGRLFGGGRGSTVIYEGSGTPAVVNLAKIESGQVLTPAEVYASNVDSVVGITTQVTTNIWGRTVSSAASGSGFVLTADGYIVTNYHVIEDATSITVQFKSGDKFPATLVGGEENMDVAVLKIDAQNLTPVRLGSSTDLVVGEDVVAIGNPLGEMTFSMTGGMVSALDKRLSMSDGTIINVLQTDAAINSGNSGGPLFNMYGQVIGITNAKYSNNGSSQASIEGICFAIPIDDVKGVIQDLIEHGYVTGKPYMGATLSTADADEAQRYGRSGGARVEELVPGGAAQKAGLQVGDIITKLDDAAIDGWESFMTQRDRHKAGDTVTLTVDRAGQFIEIKLTFDEQPRNQEAEATPSPTPQQGNQGGNGGNGFGGNGYGYNYGFGYDPYSWFGW